MARTTISQTAVLIVDTLLRNIWLEAPISFAVKSAGDALAVVVRIVEVHIVLADIRAIVLRPRRGLPHVNHLARCVCAARDVTIRFGVRPLCCHFILVVHAAGCILSLEPRTLLVD